MRYLARRFRPLAVLMVVMTMIGAPMTAGANHGADGPAIQQVGNGRGDSGPVIRDFAMGSVLFNNQRFPRCSSGSCVERPLPKYLGWGVVNTEIDGNWFLSLARVGSDDGYNWSKPEIAIERKPESSVPFLIGFTSTHYDVVYNGTQTGSGNAPNYPFSIYYKIASTTIPNTDINSMHVADSEDGINWVNDRPLTQDPANPLVSGSQPSQGPNDVIFQPTASSASNCAGASGATPWNCRYVLTYDRGGRTGIAGSGDGVHFTARSTPILNFGAAGTWDSTYASAVDIRIRVVNGVREYMLFYSGSGPGPSCGGGSFSCLSIGTASSTDGLNFVKSPSNPATPNTLPDAIGNPSNRHSLWNPEAIDDASGSGHSKVYYAAYYDEPFPRRFDTFLGSTAEAPGAGPTITISSPQSGFSSSNAISSVFYLTDTLGTSIGLDMSTLSITVDGNPVAGASSTPTVVGSHRYVGKKVTTPASQMILADGPHIFEVSVADLDGNVSTETSTFTVDTTAPGTTMTAWPSSPAIGFPNGIGTFHATTVESPAGTGIERVRATVTNPLGQVKTWESNAPAGFNITQVSAFQWNWNWVAPVLDPHFAVPGEYLIRLGSVDGGGNFEGASPANTTSVLVI